MAQKSMIIIGGGIAGLSAGCYARMNGYKSRIFEMHKIPGGLCTAWERKGFKVDGCLHWLMGSKPGSDFYKFWLELGAIQNREVLDHDILMRIEMKNGKAVNFYTDLDRLEKHLVELAPEDTDRIREFVGYCRKFAKLDLPMDKAFELLTAWDKVKFLFLILPNLGMLKKFGNMSLRQFADGFKSPILREAFPLIWLPDFTSLFIVMGFAWMHKKQAGYLIGSSLPLARAIEARYVALGGEITYKAPVQKIIVENDRAVGVKLADGTEHRADWIISAADGHATIFDMLGGKYINDDIKGYYDKFPIFPSILHVSFGVNRAFDDVPHSAQGDSIPLKTPLDIAGMKHDRLHVHIYNFDPTFAPKGKTVVKVMLPSDFNYWQNMRRQDMPKYKAEKEKLADALASALDERFPGFKSQVEMTDVATPATFHRYTGNWQGTFEGFMLTPDNWTLQMKKNLPGLDGLYMAGQWVVPGGGLPPAAFSARHAVQLICDRDGKRFEATVP
jgi:phytoene dehydrogenase-like protein